MKKLIGELTINLSRFLFAVVTIIAYPLLRAWVLVCIWDWHVFRHIREPLPFGLALGAVLFLGFACKNHKVSWADSKRPPKWAHLTTEEKGRHLAIIVNNWLHPFIWLGVAWVLKVLVY